MNNEVLGMDVNFTSECEISLGKSNYSNMEPLDDLQQFIKFSHKILDLDQRCFLIKFPISLYNSTNHHPSNLSLRSLIFHQCCKRVLTPIVVSNVIAACYCSQEVGAQGVLITLYFFLLFILVF
ncbi:hypothetical protein M9H77_16880 [Catharanthus roseus]|uniref:Uncharacterized protein n=1 Tax=Catharanthus roseus TaxID=4058 RepID=A0ACC0B368_CATRO|nr:hypothetical protein M9H77_16880 [Catharanthus roseus]